MLKISLKINNDQLSLYNFDLPNDNGFLSLNSNYKIFKIHIHLK